MFKGLIAHCVKCGNNSLFRAVNSNHFLLLSSVGNVKKKFMLWHIRFTDEYFVKEAVSCLVYLSRKLRDCITNVRNP